MKKLLRLMSEGRRKRIAYGMFKNQGDFLNAVSGNTQLHQWLKANEPFPYFPHRFELAFRAFPHENQEPSLAPPQSPAGK